jgi:hypothetical protein
MKLLLYVVGGFVSTAAGILLITWGQAPAGHPVMLFALWGLCGIPVVGTFWMAYMTIRYEKNPFPMLLLAFLIPFTFLWYYFERFRPTKRNAR